MRSRCRTGRSAGYCIGWDVDAVGVGSKPPLDGKRLARIRRFLVEVDRAVKKEDEHEAVVVYMDEGFVHQAQGSAYSYFFTDENGVVDDGFGRTTGKGLRMIMVHTIPNMGLWFRVIATVFRSKKGGSSPRARGKDGKAVRISK